jgi:hypothetical protein
VKLHVTSLQTPVGELPITTGGMMVLKGTLTKSLDAGVHARSSKIDMRFVGTASGKQPAEFLVDFETANPNEESDVPGGEMPAAPAAPASTPTAPVR